MNLEKPEFINIVRQAFLTVGFLLFVVLGVYGVSNISNKQAVTPQPKSNVNSDELASVRLVPAEHGFNKVESIEEDDGVNDNGETAEVSKDSSSNSGSPDGKQSFKFKKILPKVAEDRSSSKSHR